MTEETEIVRGDDATREVNEREVLDYSGKRLVVPRGTATPSSGRPGELFVKQNTGTNDELYIWDGDAAAWVKVGP